MSKLLLLALASAVTACAVDPDSTTDSTEVAAQLRRAAPVVDVAFSGCVESIGVGLVATATATPLVPATIIPVGAGTPVTPLVARTASCDITVTGHHDGRGQIIQIGLVIVPPATPGDIDNYTLGYVTDDPRLADALELEGVEVHRAQRIDYHLTATALAVSVPSRDPALTIAGTITPSTVPNGSFHANWWRQGPRGLVEMATAVPVIDNGTADLTLTTTYKPLVDLLGAETAPFPVLQQLNTFSAAQMTVTVD